jgi:heme-degrading monooxygenase HmoA
MVYLSMTRLKLKSAIYLLPFSIQNEQVIRQIRTSRGFLKGKELATPNLSMWTATLWDSQEDLRVFYLSGSHKKAMKNISEWSSEAVSGHQEIDSIELPAWDNIRLQLLSIGHFINLKESSFAHQEGMISKPKFTLLTRYILPS